MEIIKQINKLYNESKDKELFLSQIKSAIHELSEHKDQPVDCIQWIPLEKVQANNYNPNSVAVNEMKLLYISISHDGYTQPIVTIYDEERDKYIIVDGFHRYSIMRSNDDIFKINKGMLPCVVIKKDINDRMASTIRHNRARGKHSINGMSNMVFSMLDNGWEDKEICMELGVEPDELVRLKYVTGFAKLYENVEYKKSWETKKQIKLRMEYNENKNIEPIGNNTVLEKSPEE